MATKLQQLEAALRVIVLKHGIHADKYGGAGDAVRIAYLFTDAFVRIFGAQLGSDAEYEFYEWARNAKMACPEIEGFDFYYKTMSGKQRKVPLNPRCTARRLLENVEFLYVVLAASNAVRPRRQPVFRRTPVFRLFPPKKLVKRT